MTDLLVAQKTVTFTIASMPRRAAQLKTLERLMRMQPHIQRGLDKLARRRRQTDNQPRARAGRTWIDREPTVKLVHPARGDTFTLRLTPQILPDLRSVEKYLSAKAAKKG